jgi:hypothetical protein
MTEIQMVKNSELEIVSDLEYNNNSEYDMSAEYNYNLAQVFCKMKDYKSMKNYMDSAIILDYDYRIKSFSLFGDYYFDNNYYSDGILYYNEGARQGDYNCINSLIKYYKYIEPTDKELLNISLLALKFNHIKIGLNELNKICKQDELYVRLITLNKKMNNDGITNAINALKTMPIVIYYLNNCLNNVNNKKQCVRCKQETMSMQYPCGHQECWNCYLKNKQCINMCANIFYILEDN